MKLRKLTENDLVDETTGKHYSLIDVTELLINGHTVEDVTDNVIEILPERAEE